MVWFDLDAGGDFNTIDPENLMLKWDPYNLTMNLEASVTISLWGYRVNIEKVVVSVSTINSYIFRDTLLRKASKFLYVCRKIVLHQSFYGLMIWKRVYKTKEYLASVRPTITKEITEKK